MGAAEVNLKQRLIEYVVENGADLGFTKYFWRGCEPLPRDIELFSKFVDIVRLASNESAPKNVLDRVDVNKNLARDWANLERMPKLALYLRALLQFGEPAPGCVWLTTECSHGYANPIGQFVQVPKAIGSWKDVEEVLLQMKPIGESTLKFSKAYIFGFFVGMIVGDAHKPKQGRGHRNVQLVLSKRYETNPRIGDFTSFCANQLGLRMERAKDIPKPPDKPFGFYEWVSQSSPFIDWIFNVVIGLDDGQHTTYDPVKLDWALDASFDFRLGLLHGIAESDGSVSVASQTVEFWVIPDWEFMIKFLATFGLNGFRNREAVSLVKSQAINSFKVPVFSQYLRTVRYGLLELMATTRKLERTERLPVEVRKEITRLAAKEMSVPSIVLEIAKTKKLLVSFEAAQRWAMKSGKYHPRPSLHLDDTTN
jgi:hypothetical protein